MILKVSRLLRRHPLPITAYFHHSFVLTYAFPAVQLHSLLPPGLELDTFNQTGFLAIACVDTRSLRPSFLPAWLGQNFNMIGYRLFVRYQTPQGRKLRGLYVQRSIVDQPLMAITGNWLTHYRWTQARFQINSSLDKYELKTTTKDGSADLDASMHLGERNPPLPPETVFSTWCEARRFAGPMPFTFDYEPETHSILRVEGVRSEWHPQPLSVRVTTNRFLTSGKFASFDQARLVSAFALHQVPYRWKRGIVEKL